MSVPIYLSSIHTIYLCDVVSGVCQPVQSVSFQQAPCIFQNTLVRKIVCESQVSTKEKRDYPLYCQKSQLSDADGIIMNSFEYFIRSSSFFFWMVFPFFPSVVT